MPPSRTLSVAWCGPLASWRRPSGVPLESVRQHALDNSWIDSRDSIRRPRLRHEVILNDLKLRRKVNRNQPSHDVAVSIPGDDVRGATALLARKELELRWIVAMTDLTHVIISMLLETGLQLSSVFAS